MRVEVTMAAEATILVALLARAVNCYWTLLLDKTAAGQDPSITIE